MKHFTFCAFVETPDYSNSFKAHLIRSVIEQCIYAKVCIPHYVEVDIIGSVRITIQLPLKTIHLSRRVQEMVERLFDFERNPQAAMKLFEDAEIAFTGIPLRQVEYIRIGISQNVNK